MRFSYEDWSDFARSKIRDQDSLKAYLNDIRREKTHEAPTIATLNGSFDLMHAGHLHIIYAASRAADILVVALNSDHSVKRYKHPTRPIIPLQQRMEMVAALAIVDFVTWFEEDDPRNLLEKLCPDIHVNGAEYGKDCIEASTVHKIGGRLVLVERVPGLSTSHIIQKIQAIPQITA